MKMNGKKILLGVSGSIAAYKSAPLVRLLVKAGATVKVIMTPASAEFVTPLTLSTLSRNPVLTQISSNDNWADHVALGRWADLMLIAPLSCNTLSKMAHGQCDNLLLAVYLSATCPVMVAPAMDEDMWRHPSTRDNLDKIRSWGNRVIPVVHGELASGLTGEGRMAEPETILEEVIRELMGGKELLGKKAMVTAGPTYEPIDPVRFIGNHSSGKMGIAIARVLREKGASVKLIVGPVTVPVNLPGADVVHVQSAADMFDACSDAFPDMDITVMAAAVADYTPVEKAEQKIKKQADTWTLPLQRTKDILKSLGAGKKPGQVLVGFALETEREKEHARKKLEEKNADLIVLNSLRDPGAGFGQDTNKITIIDKAGREFSFGTKTKAEVAEDIVQHIIGLIHG
jgi:phosphopantothenoylcysteine decarboxylase/phosphopantothenate--cysteine ligase